MCNDYCELTGNAGEEDICFCSDMVSRLSTCDTHIGFKVVDRTFYDSPDFIKSGPFIRIPLDAGKSSENHVFIGISGMSLFRSATRIFVAADILSLYHMDFGTAPFFLDSPAFFVTMPEIFHCKRRVLWTGGIAVKVVPGLWKSTFIAYIIRDQDFGKMEFIFQEIVSFYCVKSRIAKKGIW